MKILSGHFKAVIFSILILAFTAPQARGATASEILSIKKGRCQQFFELISVATVKSFRKALKKIPNIAHLGEFSDQEVKLLREIYLQTGGGEPAIQNFLMQYRGDREALLQRMADWWTALDKFNKDQFDISKEVASLDSQELKLKYQELVAAGWTFSVDPQIGTDYHPRIVVVPGARTTRIPALLGEMPLTLLIAKAIYQTDIEVNLEVNAQNVNLYKTGFREVIRPIISELYYQKDHTGSKLTAEGEINVTLDAIKESVVAFLVERDAWLKIYPSFYQLVSQHPNLRTHTFSKITLSLNPTHEISEVVNARYGFPEDVLDILDEVNVLKLGTSGIVSWALTNRLFGGGHL